MIHLRLREKSLRIWQWLCNWLPIDKKKIYIDSFFGRGFNCNPKYISIALHNKDKSLKFIWHTSGCRKTAPEWVSEISNEYRRIYERSTSHIWIDNARKDLSERKRKGQYYVQTWHGTLGLKTCEKDIEDKLPARYVKSAKHDSSMIDLFISNGQFMTNVIRNSMWYDGEIYECGAPRMDVLVKWSENRDIVRSKLGLGTDDILVLYAPTFRQNPGYEYKLDFSRLIASLKSRFGVNIKVLVRLHPNLASEGNFISEAKDIIDVSSYPDMNELMTACDVMINDYSSSMFEFGYIQKPVFLYMEDLEDFKKDRGLYFEIEDLPFPVSYNEDELNNAIRNFNEVEYLEKINLFFSNNKVVETGHASDDVADRILSVIYD